MTTRTVITIDSFDELREAIVNERRWREYFNKDIGRGRRPKPPADTFRFSRAGSIDSIDRLTSFLEALTVTEPMPFVTYGIRPNEGAKSSVSYSVPRLLCDYNVFMPPVKTRKQEENSFISMGNGAGNDDSEVMRSVRVNAAFDFMTFYAEFSSPEHRKVVMPPMNFIAPGGERGQRATAYISRAIIPKVLNPV